MSITILLRKPHHLGLCRSFTQNYKSMESTFKNDWKEECRGGNVAVSKIFSPLWIKHISWIMVSTYLSVSYALHTSGGHHSHWYLWKWHSMELFNGQPTCLYMAGLRELLCHLTGGVEEWRIEEALLTNWIHILVSTLDIITGKSCKLSEFRVPPLQKSDNEKILQGPGGKWGLNVIM